MNRVSVIITVIVISLFLFVSCESSGDDEKENVVPSGQTEGEGTGSNNGDNNNTGSAVTDWETLTGDQFKEYLVQLSTGCGYVSSSTVPPGWQVTAVPATNGCTLMFPPQWQTKQFDTGIIVDSQDALSGYYVFNFYLDGVSWSPSQMADYFKGEMEQLYGPITILKEEPTEISVGGITMQWYFVYYKFMYNGSGEVGVFKILLQECSAYVNICPLTVLGGFAPLDRLSSDLCTINQIEATLKCPSGGGGNCSDYQCKLDCQANGAQDGACDADDICQCF